MSVKKHLSSSAKEEKEQSFSSVSNNSVARRNQPSVKMLVSSILNHDKVMLSRAITLIESTHPDHAQKASEVIRKCLPYANKSIRIGITGVPGVGKSTFIEAFGKYLTTIGKKVAVLTIDPSSSITKGSILGDKTRMEELVKDENAYIRPSASGDSLGGVARKTREAIILCEAAGFDTIIVETVGVGQSETAVHSMVDFFLLLKLAGAGDELQGIKRGIMEMADAIIINKADGENIKNAQRAKGELARALHLYPPKENGWTPKVTTCSALDKKGIKEAWGLIDSFIVHNKSSSHFHRRRAQQNNYWLIQTIEGQLKTNFYNHPKIKPALKKQLERIEKGEVSPFEAANELLKIYNGK
ncbi:methylmalonyl Co-A mutase-associated GTPase MeaB [Leptobacterium meishanense]|uniref:methylmalonyl Co-A mutase-associated GTPase MeaB n=1 Tax=Leptobacterium meishanense TaxID=3128904 RepID=UPI0039B75282